MTINEQIKILDNKIKQNKAKYDLYRPNAKISALSLSIFDKYESLTGEDLDIDHILYKKQNLNIVHWVKCLIKD